LKPEIETDFPWASGTARCPGLLWLLARLDPNKFCGGARFIRAFTSGARSAMIWMTGMHDAGRNEVSGASSKPEVL
jgi:hypothetical protein